ncbi:MAG: RNA 2',3'-cyclic phosphodiesterase [Deltaproteobacteria bacterium]|nr:RNA 2',3'-cyclic phosphodiesterase [Deltaproteobacteria bacterium]MDL1960717.1 RNA 2',3'-cyclic phosphodiesterase [Deltaproteobacteria bacterium]
MVRTFLAIDLPSKQLKILEEHQDRWKSAKADVRWIYPSNMHLTLKFLGEIQESSMESVVAVCKEVCCLHRGFSLSLNGTGTFPNIRRPRVLWIGIGGETDLLCKLQNSIETALEKKGFPREDRVFMPHLTVGRVRSPRKLPRLLEIFVKDKIVIEPFTVEEVIAYKSLLTPRGPLYSPLARCGLGPGKK